MTTSEIRNAVMQTIQSIEIPSERRNAVMQLLKDIHDRDILNFFSGYLQRYVKSTEKVSKSSGSIGNVAPKNISFNVRGVQFNMVFVHGGTFLMGYDDRGAHDNEKPVHYVTLSDYYIGETQVTISLWRAVMGGKKKIRFDYGDDYPMVNVSWDDIVNDFLPKLNDLTDMNFCLPTEAEWEFAARGGIKSSGYIYSGSNDIDRVAWYNNNSKGVTHPVAQKKPNELGIYDMSGNVLEWCNDRYGRYEGIHQTNPKGCLSGKWRVLRGGTWDFQAEACHVYARYGNDSNYRPSDFGFRLYLSSNVQ